MSERLKHINSALHSQNRIAQLRNSSKINRNELLNTLIPENVNKHFAEVYDLIRNNPAVFQHADIEELSRKEERLLSTKQALLIMRQLKINLEQDQFKFVSAMYALCFFGVGQSIKGLVQYLLYIKTLLLFRSNSYHQQCLERATKLEDIGSFSLTQMHHGSFSRGIATEAVYNHSNKEFIINTNGQKGMKFWIGNTAQTANKTVLWAQLIVDGVSYGPHCFIMQLRDDKTHEVVEGVTIGDCGPKNGLNSIDNGYILIKNVRIPSKALLGKLGSVNAQGKYQSTIKTNQQRFGLHMSPLSSGRAIISFSALTQSMAALTIAIRYASQRHQFKTSEELQQNLIIDYPTTRYRLMAPLATNIVHYFAGAEINKLYIENSQNFTDPNKKIVSQLHAISAVLKAKASWFTNSVITQCRQVLGGHGYSMFSGLKRYYHDNDIHSTWEGDNNMLLQQTSKYLLKAIKSKEAGSVLSLNFVFDGVEPLQCSEQTLNNLPQLRTLLRGVFVHRHSSAVKEMSKMRQQAKKNGLSSEDTESYVWNGVQPFFCNEMALAYGDLILFESMYKSLANHKTSQHNKLFLTTCLKMWTYSTLLKASIDSHDTRKTLQKLLLEACDVIYSDCIAVTDVLCPPSFVIGSPFAQEDGQGMKAYINLLFSAKKTFGRVSWFERFLQLKEEY